MMSPLGRLVVGAALVDSLERPSRILAARRYATSHAGGWEFPGGKVEPGESPLAALRRELREELDLSVTVGRQVRGPLHDGAWPISDNWRISVWLATPVDDAVQPRGAHDAVRWLGAHELDSVNWLPADDAIVAALRRMMVPTPV